MTSIPSMKDLLEAGSHFGHEAKRWNPKMAPYIFTNRSGIHVIDLEQTEKKLKEAVEFIRNEVSRGRNIVFLATKKQAQDFTREQAIRSGAMYMTNRWVGGLFTNFETVRKTLNHFKEASEQKAAGTASGLTKKELLLLDRHLEKIEKVFGGVKDMDRMPDIMFVVDSKKELNAVLEARKMNVKIVAITDTNSDPTLIDYPIPANDDAIKSIQLIVKTIADAVEEGRQMVGKRKVDEIEIKEKADEIKKEKVKAQPKAEKPEEPKEETAAEKETVKDEPKKAVKEKTAKKTTKKETK